MNIPEGLETAIQKMKNGEVAQVIVKSDHGFGKDGNESLGVPGGYSLCYEVTLSSFEKAKEAHQLNPFEKVQHAKIFKEKGTNFFKKNKFQQAAAKYQKVVDFLSIDEEDEDSYGVDEEERRDLLRAGRLNLAMCYIKLGRWMEARDTCTKVIEAKGDKIAKAWFRRGEANFSLKDFGNAKADFEKTLTLEPENKAAKNKLVLCQQAVKAEKEREKKMFGNIFERMNRMEEREKFGMKGDSEVTEVETDKEDLTEKENSVKA